MGCEQVAATVARTLAWGGADVVSVVAFDMGEPVSGTAPDDPTPAGRESVRSRGVVEFATARAVLTVDHDGRRHAYDGPVSYEQQPDGRWTRQTGRSEQLSVNHPCWPLTVLRHGCRRAEPTGGGDYVVGLGHDPVAAVTFPGLDVSWRQLHATAGTDDADRVREVDVQLTTGKADPAPWMRIHVAFSGFHRDPPHVELPERSTDLKEYLTERFP